MTAEQIAKAVIGYRIAHNCSTKEALAEIQCLIAISGCATSPLAAAVMQQEAGEPVAYQYWTVGEFWKETSRLGYEARRDVGEKVRALYATPQVSLLQARVPLTERQVDALLHTKHFDKSYKLHASDKVCIDWYRLGLRDGERSHLIGLETKE